MRLSMESGEVGTLEPQGQLLASQLGLNFLSLVAQDQELRLGTACEAGSNAHVSWEAGLIFPAEKAQGSPPEGGSCAHKVVTLKVALRVLPNDSRSKSLEKARCGSEEGEGGAVL